MTYRFRLHSRAAAAVGAQSPLIRPLSSFLAQLIRLTTATSLISLIFTALRQQLFRCQVTDHVFRLGGGGGGGAEVGGGGGRGEKNPQRVRETERKNSRTVFCKDSSLGSFRSVLANRDTDRQTETHREGERCCDSGVGRRKDGGRGRGEEGGWCIDLQFIPSTYKSGLLRGRGRG